MALLDEGKMQGNLINILDLLRKQAACCNNVAAASFASSSLIAAGVFFTVSAGGDVKVYDHPGGTLLTPAAYGVLTHP